MPYQNGPKRDRTPEELEAIQKIKELSRIKHLLSDWESHPKGQNGADDKGGFIETMESAIKFGWQLSGPRIGIINKMYAQYVEGVAVDKKEGKLNGNDGQFKLGEITGTRCTEGWRIAIRGTIIGTPIIREHAYIIAHWLGDSIHELDELFSHGNENFVKPQKEVRQERTQKQDPEPDGQDDF